jgi:hypothetical protein
MPKVSQPLFSETASGSVSPCLTFSQRNSGQQVRYQRKQKDKITVLRTVARANYSAAVLAWNLLTLAEKTVYVDRAKNLHYTGFNLFMKENIGAQDLSLYSYYGTGIYGVREYGFQL